MKIPFVDLKTQYQNHKEEIDEAISSVIEQTAFIGGKFVKEFEQKFAEKYGVAHMISCGNGTDSLYIIMKMLGIGHGDEVITVSNSWISTSETISQTGAKPVFVDCDPVYYTIDADRIEDKISNKTKAILPVHIYGQMCDMDKLTNIAQKYSLYLIEDCAQAHFSTFMGTKAGMFGIAGSFSFYPGKNLGAYGDAGGIITNDPILAEKMTMYARHGALIKHKHKMEGINSRLDSLQASILTAKLNHILDWTKKRRENAEKITRLLTGTGDVIVPAVRKNSEHSFHLYVIQTAHRDKLAAWLKEKGIETSVHYPTPLPLLEAYGYLQHIPEDFPVAHQLSKRILSLPLYPELTDEQIAYLVDSIKEFFQSQF